MNLLFTFFCSPSSAPKCSRYVPQIHKKVTKLLIRVFDGMVVVLDQRGLEGLDLTVRPPNIH